MERPWKKQIEYLDELVKKNETRGGAWCGFRYKHNGYDYDFPSEGCPPLQRAINAMMGEVVALAKKFAEEDLEKAKADHFQELAIMAAEAASALGKTEKEVGDE